MATINDNTALLLYRVGPVFCASPCQPIASIITPPPLTRPPGSDSAQPGIFKHASTIVRSLDLRYKFGVEESHWTQPGRTVITQLAKQHIGFYVDEILDVISMPKTGWGALPALLPRGVFTRTLTLQDRIYLYADFTDLQRIPDSGYLRQYIQQLTETAQIDQAEAENALPPSKPVKNSEITRAETNPVKVNKAPDSSARPTTFTTRNHESVPVQPHRIPAKENAPIDQAKNQNTSVSRALHADKKNRAIPQPELSKHATSSHQKTTYTTKAQHSREKTSQSSSLKQPDIIKPIKSEPVPVSSQAASRSVHNRTSQVPAKSAPAAGSPEITNSSDNGDHSGMLLIGLILFLGLIGGGVWYLFYDEPDILSPSNATPTDVSDLSNESITPVQKKPAVFTTTPAAPEPDIPSEHSQKTVPSDTQSNSEQETQRSNEISSKAFQATEANSPEQTYHASIEKDAQGLTITVDVPADDPDFAQTAEDTTTNDNKNVIAGENTTTQSSGANIDRAPPVAAPAAKQTPQKVEIIHIVVKGDTLWAIAKRYVKNPFRYPELARLSKIKNPDLIYPGDRVRIIKQKQIPKPDN